jgi:RNA polymerase sigma-70 factor (ECF subfamily)
MFNKEELNTFYRYCISLTAEAHTAGDLLQCCLEKYVRRNTSGVENVKAYFRRMIRNQFIDDQRKEGNQQFYELDEEKTVIPLNLRSLDDIIVEREMAEIILRSLTPHEREILFLWAVEGFTVQDISNDLGIPKGTLLSRLHRLKIKVKNKLGARKIMGRAI